ncbi:hypothetical protein CEXT_279381 [Caerostris extrusa]|uniref:Uncharacterized protein n=1 Tax=Caerostris extrusa TaxID=172846 RepID=A0AAV4XES0_CAEEX|nr:hypothetical protein CEXT_279381 [Caerostris extrusa]
MAPKIRVNDKLPLFRFLEVVWNSEKEPPIIWGSGGPERVAINRIIIRDFANSSRTINVTLTLCPINKKKLSHLPSSNASPGPDS